MIKIVDGKFEMTGDLLDLDLGNSDLYFRFNENKELHITNPDPRLIVALRTAGLIKLKNSIVDLKHSRIELSKSGRLNKNQSVNNMLNEKMAKLMKEVEEKKEKLQKNSNEETVPSTTE